METKVISYSDTFVPVPAITRRNWKWKLTKLTFLILAISFIIFIKWKLAIKDMFTNKSTPTRIYHFNPCDHITPEPEVILHEEFDTRDYFFPYSYKERKCASLNKSTGKDNEDVFQTCFGDKYHCITRYQERTVIRIPYPGNGTFAHWKTETVHVAVACECSTAMMV